MEQRGVRSAALALVVALIACSAVQPAACWTWTAPWQFVRSKAMELTGHDSNYGLGYDMLAVKADLAKVLTTSQPQWPADGGNYGGLMIRLAWHCAGSYRQSDGRGGCAGGWLRFNPGLSWKDNANLDKARDVLWPVKEKYGSALSWSDLIMLSGTVAIEEMGGPKFGFCAGRTDDVDGSPTQELGPTPVQDAIAPCPVQGDCKDPLGADTLGLIYVDPEGFQGKPDPARSAPEIRSTFGRMGMNDIETVALIGGGHAFGKAHGACPTGPGPDPSEDPSNPWPGTCGKGADKGKGPNTFTAGFEGQWTTKPDKWDNEYFTNLLAYDWEVHKGPGGHMQWRPKKVHGQETPDIFMLTTDVALLHDPEYLELVKYFAANQTALDDMFGKTWYKLAGRDMGPVTRCLGPEVAPPQSFQNPLPPPPKHQPDFSAVKRAIEKALTAKSSALPGDEATGGSSYYGALFSTLAWRCAATYRATDFAGGCNGGQIRFSPQKDWPINKGLVGGDQACDSECTGAEKSGSALDVLQPIKDKFGDSLTWADLIVLAGTVALEKAGNAPISFCGGRSDALDGGDVESYTQKLVPRTYYKNPTIEVKDSIKVAGLTPAEYVALAAQLRSPTYMKGQGYSGSWTTNTGTLSNEYFKVLLKEKWEKSESKDGKLEFKAHGKDIYMTPTDMALRWDADLVHTVQEYAADNNAFLTAFAAAWTKMMNADRFDGPTGNVCTPKSA